MGSIILGILIIALGIIMVIKSEGFYNAFGSISFFDRYLSTEGGGRLGYKLIGMFVIFLGVLFLTGMFGGFMRWVFSPLMRWNQPGTAPEL